MKRLLTILAIVFLAAMLTLGSAAAYAPAVSFKVRGLPPGGLLVLPVGESHPFEIGVNSNEPFTAAVAMTDQYYPGRGVFWHDSDRAVRDTSATLHLTITGKNATTDLPAVCDWPEPGDCWPKGVAPVSIVVGVRYPGGVTISERFPFAVQVP